MTTSISTDFIGAASEGAWLEGSATVRRAGRRLAFAQALVSADGKVVAQASGVFAVLDPSRSR